MFRVTFDDIIGDRADSFVSHSLVETLGGAIEGGDAKKNVRMLAKDALLDMFDEHSPNSLVARTGHDAEQMNIAAKGSTHIQQHKADDSFV